MCVCWFFFSSRRRHTRCALVTGVQTCALPILMKNLDRFGGLVHSQRVLLALTQAGLSREDSYRLVQKHALKIWQQGGDFLQALLGETEVTARLKPAQLTALFDLGHPQIGRASIRGRGSQYGYISVVSGSIKK